MTARVISFLIGYVFGMIPTGYLIGRMNGIDIRERGSGNIGSTNIERTLGLRWALLTLIVDLLKSIIPLMITYLIFRSAQETGYLIAGITGFGAMFGHSYPLTLGFKGGKGVATGAGMLIFLGPKVMIPAFAVFLLVVLLTKTVSLGSILAAVMFSLAGIYWLSRGIPLGWSGCLGSSPLYFAESCVITLAVTLLIVFRHRSNVRRILKGEESKIHLKWKR